MSNQLTVFVIDDDLAAAASMVALLTSVGLQVAAYQSAEEFLAGDDSRIGCLVLDLRLPGMSGLELQEALAETGADIPIIFASGNVDRGLRHKALERGAVACLEKPCDGDVLCDYVRKAPAQR